MPTDAQKEALWKRLAAIHERVQWMANQEAVSALVNGWAAQGGYFEAKEKLIAEAETILDKLEGK